MFWEEKAAARSVQVWIGETLAKMDLVWTKGLYMESVSILNWWVNLILHIKNMNDD